MHDDNVSNVYIAMEILFCQCAAKENIYLRFLALIVGVCEICPLNKSV